MKHNFKIGDRVKVVRKVEEEEGWDDVWVDEMDACIGKTGIIGDISGKRIWVFFLKYLIITSLLLLLNL